MPKKIYNFLLESLILAVVFYGQMSFVNFFLKDTCLDRGGAFDSEGLICKNATEAISLKMSPIFYVLTAIIFGLISILLLKVVRKIRN